ncbi:hypothetical protein [Azorhizobium caulinodans]|uniref:hypothetical protein n=1 Tax=Azorhizobium caulinodans TaxID=7 RepID=UPI002FBEF030
MTALHPFFFGSVMAVTEPFRAVDTSTGGLIFFGFLVSRLPRSWPLAMVIASTLGVLENSRTGLRDQGKRLCRPADARRREGEASGWRPGMDRPLNSKNRLLQPPMPETSTLPEKWRAKYLQAAKITHPVRVGATAQLIRSRIKKQAKSDIYFHELL